MKTRTFPHLWRALTILGFAWFAAFLPPANGAGNSKDFPGNNWQNGLASVTADKTLYKAGEVVTVTVTCNSDFWCVNLILGVPGAISAELDGVEVPLILANSFDHFFDHNPHPAPDYCQFIRFPDGAGTHVVKFQLGEGASGKFTKFKDNNGVTQIAGPFVILDRPEYQMWSSLFPIEIEPLPYGLEKVAETAQPEGAKPEDVITYKLIARPPPTTREIIIEDTLAPGVTLEGPTNGGVVNKNKIKWTISGGSNTTITYQVKVGKYRDLKPGTKAITTNATGTAVLAGGRKVSSRTTNKVKLILPWTIAGLTKDIQFDFLKKTQPVLKRVTPNVDVELLDAAGDVVDTDTGNPSGKFELHARNPGKHRIRAKVRVDRFDDLTDTIVTGGAYLLGGANVEVLATDPPATKYPKDVFMPVSLNNRVVAQLKGLRDFKTLEGNFAGFNYDSQSIQDFLNSELGLNLELPGPYDVSEAVKLLEKAQAGDFQDNMGEPVFFEKLFDGTGEQDAWSAVVRLSAFLDTLTVRQVEFIKLAEKAGTSIAKGIALSVVVKIGQIKGAKIKELRDQKRFDELPPMADARVEAAKIATLGFGIGIALPGLLDQLGYTGAEKARIIEIFAKVTRYGSDLLLRKFLPGKLQDDLLFEALFQPIRLITIVGLADLYTKETQAFLNDVSTQMALGIYDEDTAKVLEALDRENSRIHERTELSLGLINQIMSVQSFTRALDGVLFKLNKPLAAAAASGNYKDLANGFLGIATILTDNGSDPIKGKLPDGKVVDTGKMTNATHTPLKTTVLVAGIGAVVEITLWELVLRIRDLLSTQSITLHGKLSDGSNAFTRAAFAPVDSSPYMRRAFATAPPTTRAKVTPPANPLLTDYVAALKAIDKQIDSRTPGDLAALQQQLAAAHAQFFGPLIALHDRLQMAAVTLPEEKQADARRFVLAVEALLARVNAAYETLFILPRDPSAAMTALARKNIKKVTSALGEIDDILALAASLSTITDLPGRLQLREGNAPADADVLSGNAFDLEVEVKNVGDTATTPQNIQLTPGTDLVLVGAAATTVPALAPDESVVLVWSVKARAVDPAGQALSYVVTLTGETDPNAQLTGFLLVEPPAAP